ncbi:hypothetical protein D3C72_1763190 [compost metagenome]
MAAFSSHIDLDAVGRRHHCPRVDANRALAHGRPVVHGIDGFHRELLKQPVLDHFTRARVAFFSRLEDEHGAAIEITGFSQIARSAHQHGSMAIMATGMHQALFA